MKKIVCFALAFLFVLSSAGYGQELVEYKKTPGNSVEIKYTFEPLSFARYQKLTSAGAKPVLDKLGFSAKAGAGARAEDKKEEQQLMKARNEVLNSDNINKDELKQISAQLKKLITVYVSNKDFSEKCPIIYMAEFYDEEVTGKDLLALTAECKDLEVSETGKSFKTFKTPAGKTIKLPIKLSADTIYGPDGKELRKTKGICWKVMNYSYYRVLSNLILSL